MTVAVKRCALYRHFDVDRILLYVGISEVPVARGKDHAAESVWVRFAAHAEVTWYDNREAALAAERLAIINEEPLFNRQHAQHDNWATVQYLARKLEIAAPVDLSAGFPWVPKNPSDFYENDVGYDVEGCDRVARLVAEYLSHRSSGAGYQELQSSLADDLRCYLKPALCHAQSVGWVKADDNWYYTMPRVHDGVIEETPRSLESMVTRCSAAKLRSVLNSMSSSRLRRIEDTADNLWWRGDAAQGHWFHGSDSKILISIIRWEIVAILHSRGERCHPLGWPCNVS